MKWEKKNASKNKNCSFNNLPVPIFWKNPHVVQFLNGGFKLIILFCKLSEDKDISEVVMTWFSEFYENYKDLAAYAVTNGNYFVSLILVWAIAFLDTCLLFFNRFQFV